MTEYERLLQSSREYNIVIHSITEYCRVLQSIRPEWLTFKKPQGVLGLAVSLGNCFGIHIKDRKTNTMTNTWRNTKTKTHKDKNDRE